MVAEITVNNTEEFQELVDNKDIRIARAIVEGILENSSTPKPIALRTFAPGIKGAAKLATLLTTLETALKAFL